MMKKICWASALLLALLAGIAVTSCTPRDQIKEGVKELQKELPMDAGGGVTITAVGYNEAAKELVYIATSPDIGEEMLSVPEDVKTQMSEAMTLEVKNMATSDKDMQQLIKMLKSENASIVYKFVTDGGTEVLKLTIPCSKL